MGPPHNEKPAPALTGNGLQNDRAGEQIVPQASTLNRALPQTKLLPRHHNRALARLAYYRDRVDLATSLIERALALQEQLTWGLDLDHMRDQVSAFARDVLAYRQSAS